MPQGKALDFEFLKRSPLFEGLAENQISRLVGLAKVHEFATGETVVEEGSSGDAVFVLCEGRVTVSAAGPDTVDLTLATLDERGAFFGEVAVVDQGPRSATVKAETAATILELTLTAIEQFFSHFSDAEPIILRNIAKVLARRLREANIVIGSR